MKIPVATPNSSIERDETTDVERTLVAPEVTGDVRVLGLTEKGGRGLLGHQIHPDIYDVHARFPFRPALPVEPRRR